MADDHAQRIHKELFLGMSLDTPDDDPRFRIDADIVDVVSDDIAPSDVSHHDAFPIAVAQITEDLLLFREGADDIVDGMVIGALPIGNHYRSLCDNPRAWSGENSNRTQGIDEESHAWYTRSLFAVDWTREVSGQAHGHVLATTVGTMVDWEPIPLTVSQANALIDDRGVAFTTTAAVVIDPDDGEPPCDAKQIPSNCLHARITLRLTLTYQ